MLDALGTGVRDVSEQKYLEWKLGPLQEFLATEPSLSTHLHLSETGSQRVVQDGPGTDCVD